MQITSARLSCNYSDYLTPNVQNPPYLAYLALSHVRYVATLRTYVAYVIR